MHGRTEVDGRELDVEDIERGIVQLARLRARALPAVTALRAAQLSERVYVELLRDQ